MSYLDNLENNLKALENQEQRDPDKTRRDRERREADRASALLRAPYAEALKNSPFTLDLMTHCRTIGHGQRVLVRFTWIGETLRLDAQTRRMELIPASDGIQAVFSADGTGMGSTAVDPLTDDPEALARRWLEQA